MVLNDAAIFSAMQEDRPYKSYKKTILGQVYVTYMNPFSGQPEGLILKGTDKDDTSKIDVWSSREDVFFRRVNKRHFEQGYIMEFVRPELKEITEEEKYNTFSDAEITKILSDRSLVLQNALNKMTSEAAVYRMLKLAKEQEKSEKIIQKIEARLSEVQQSE